MKDRTFLIGRFLPSHASVYRYARRARVPGLAPDVLARRFETRARTFRARLRQYAVVLQGCIALVFLVVIAAFQAPVHPRETFEVPVVDQEVVTLEEIVPTRQQVVPPPPPRPPVPVEVPNDVILEEDALDLDATLDLGEPLAALPPPPPVADEAPEEDDQEVFVVVEQMPEMIGGFANLLKDLEYPAIARQAGLEGMVVVKIIVDEEGRPQQPQVLRSVHETLDEAAVAAVMKQRFKPGRQRNRPVRVEMSISVRFQLTAN